MQDGTRVVPRNCCADVVPDFYQGDTRVCFAIVFAQPAGGAREGAQSGVMASKGMPIDHTQ